ncbi:Gfo/Idh/MocA family oxidoreductase [Solirubrobacter ginsenosidimutans]|uniref:Gfo/Idh/MocA family oxidoreductase n=1 Tax=Solirubrobacter ginsenosidimutans TaxID=490573 RepID=A0A9X3N4N3_9ACTN|nr:Gfo/Idh/MocA family oxidoreductase [Solirubrobacter ginsenosidimutans]MDA0166597.1 Gfo/Idh/MocA family oxidoreductase [Solirubrobacter ginsenosidimutans]
MARRFVSINNAPLRTAVVGYGYWGPNLVRNVMERPELEFAGLCERDPARAAAYSARYAGQPVFNDLSLVLADDTIDAVVVATPPRTHHAIVRACLEAGKHVLVEKPLATTTADAVDLLETASRNGRTLMPGHTFVYSPPVNKIKEIIAGGTLGEVYFVTSSRMNLGKYQADGVICDLAPHDLSILLYWLDSPIVEVAATGRSIFQAGIPETAFITLTFANGANANIQVSWLAPRKVREMTVVGSQRMIQYDDNAADEAVRIFDRGMEFSVPQTFGEYQLTYRSGDMIVPRLEPAEPLSLELADFAQAIRTGTEPRSSAQLGLEIVMAMEAAEESLRRNGEPIAIERAPLRVAA